MIGRILTKQLKAANPLYFKKSYSFGGAHGAHDYKVHIDKQTTWIKYPTSRRMACVQGIIQTHYKMKDPDDSDPFVHLNENSALSLENLAYNDPYHHQDSHEQFVNEPHGYNDGSDPIDSRYDTSVPTMAVIFTALALAYFFAATEYHAPAEARTFREKMYQDYIEKSLTDKNNELNDLKEAINKLSSATGGQSAQTEAEAEE